MDTTYPCTACNIFTTTHKSAYYRHIKKCTDENGNHVESMFKQKKVLYSCEVCNDFTHTHKEHYNSHVYYCAKRNDVTLANHDWVPYKKEVKKNTCSKCNKEYKLLKFYNKHILNCPPEPKSPKVSKPKKMHSCDVCNNYQTNQSSNLKRHKTICERKLELSKNPPTTKKCSKCKEIKLFDCFNKDKSRVDGYQYRCKDCYNNWYNDEDNHEDQLAKRAIVRQTPEYKIMKQDSDKNYREEHKEELNDYFVQKNKNDKQYSIGRKLRSNVNKHNVNGCDKSFFQKWIQFQFETDMTWDNHGRPEIGKAVWTYDHVKPCKSFNLEIEENQYQCNHWSNIKPTWYTQNGSKGSNIDEDLINSHAKKAIVFQNMENVLNAINNM
jgi:hypothetical protein